LLATQGKSYDQHRRMRAVSNEIWVAEDNADVRLMLDRAFKRAITDVRPIFFPNGAELVEHFNEQRTRPKLLLLDLQMPVMDGLEALKHLRKDGGCGPTPVVIFSSHEDPELIRAAYFSGAKLYLKKPQRLEEYSEVVKLCASGAEAIGQLTASAIPPGALDVKRVLKLIAET